MHKLSDRQKIRDIISFKRRRPVPRLNIEHLHPKSPEDSRIDLYIDPGYATIEEIRELFIELSKFYQMMGGAGINYTVIEERKPILDHELQR